MRKWRKMTWVLIAWTVLIVVWIIVGTNQANCEDEADQLSQSACEAGTGIGVGIVILFGILGFIVLGLIWLMSRPRHRQCPVCGADVKKGETRCRACGHDFAAVVTSAEAAAQLPAPPNTTAAGPSRAPPPPRTSKPADWYRDPGGRYDWRYFDGTSWTEHVQNDGDERTYSDPAR